MTELVILACTQNNHIVATRIAYYWIEAQMDVSTIIISTLIMISQVGWDESKLSCMQASLHATLDVCACVARCMRWIKSHHNQSLPVTAMISPCGKFIENEAVKSTSSILWCHVTQSLAYLLLVGLCLWLMISETSTCTRHWAQSCGVCCYLPSITTNG